MRYQDVYPSAPALDSGDIARKSAAELLTLEYFEAEPGTMPTEVFQQHHILLNLREEPHRVENWRDGVHRDFTFHKNEIVVTPAGLASGWRWHATSRVIVITMDPDSLERFAKNELGFLLTEQQLRDVPVLHDEDLVWLGTLLYQGLQKEFGSAVIFEGLARVFLVKLLERYGQHASEDHVFSAGFTPLHFKRVLDFVAENYRDRLTVEDMADQAGISPFHFSRLFKRAIGESPYQFLMAFRIERAKEQLMEPDRPLIDIALSCGFADQAHFTRAFKKSTGETPKTWSGNR